MNPEDSITHKTIYVKLTNRCNLTCDHCYNAVCHDQGQMSANTLQKILDYIYDLKEQGYDVDVALHGGEPTLYFESFKEIIRSSKFSAHLKSFFIKYFICINIC